MEIIEDSMDSMQNMDTANASTSTRTSSTSTVQASTSTQKPAKTTVHHRTNTKNLRPKRGADIQASDLYLSKKSKTK